MVFIKPFAEIGKEDASVAGGKGASLGEMTQAGIPVPPGFVVLTDAFDRFIDETNLNVEIDAALDTVNHEEMHTVEHASEKIQGLILAAAMPEDMKMLIMSSFKELGAEFVAVRSSATAEDGAAAAWAGQLDTYLNTTEAELLQNVQRCWASLFTPRAIFYRFEKGMHAQKISVAVVVQKMVQSDVSGIAFSVHPVTEDRNQLIIEASYGLGEAIVSGQVTPDSYVVTKEPREIIDKNIATKERGLYKLPGGGSDWKDVPKAKQEAQALSDEEILALSEAVMTIERHYGFPCDIEWAMESGKMYITQSRPITTLSGTDALLSPQALVYTRSYTRDRQYITQYAWLYGNTEGLSKLLGTPIEIERPMVFYTKDGAIETWENHEAIEAITENVRKRNQSHQATFGKVFKEFLAVSETYFKPAWMKGKTSDISELTSLAERFVEYSGHYLYLWRSILSDSVPVEYATSFKAWRDSDAHFENTGKYIEESLKVIYPSLRRYVRTMTLEEINHVPDPAQLEARMKHSVSVPNRPIFIGTLEEFEKANSEYRFIREIPSDSKEIKGQPAFPGRAVGRVRVIRNREQIENVLEGDILVSPMTIPEFLPAMKRASAFVTDEGGVMCHAAIVAREFKKPCVVGTRIASEALKDGETVEVDADNGLVRKI